jgi:hypothetical protein
MADRFSQILFDCTWGDVRLHVSTIEDELGRAIAVHEFPDVDGGATEDLGKRLRRIRAQIVFFPLPNEPQDAFIDRFNAFQRLVNDNHAHDFAHPLTGGFSARIETARVSMNGDDRDWIAVDAAFIEDGTDPEVISGAAGLPEILDGSIDDVAAASANLSSALDAYNAGAGTSLSTDVGETAVETTSGWSPDVNFRDLQVQMEQLASQINDATEDLELTTDPRRWAIYDALNQLGAACVAAFEAASAVAPRIFEFTTRAPLPLLAIAQATYGAKEASARADELRSLNDIRNPALVPAGATLRGYVPTKKAA